MFIDKSELRYVWETRQRGQRRQPLSSSVPAVLHVVTVPELELLFWIAGASIVQL